jgi:CBS domain-containing protein
VTYRYSVILSEVVESDSVKSLMTVKVETIDLKEHLKRALQKMVKHNVGSIVVVEGRKPVGILTERDISRCAARGTNILRIQVKKLMSSPLITIAPSATPQEVMTTMLKYGIRRLPVVQKGKLVGIVSERDMLRWVLRVTFEPQIPPEIREVLERQPFSKLFSRT